MCFDAVLGSSGRQICILPPSTRVTTLCTNNEAQMPAQLLELTVTLLSWYSLLVLAGMELICFLAAHKVLCFGFVLKHCRQHTSVLPVAEQHLHSIKIFFPTLPPTPFGRLGMGKRLGSTTARTADLNWMKGCSISYDIMFSNKSSGKGGWRGAFTAFPSKCSMCWRPASGVARQLPADGKQWFLFLFCLLKSTQLFFPY